MNAVNNGYDVYKYESDALSSVFHLISLNVSVYHNAKVCGNWRVTEHHLGATCFHIVTVSKLVLDVPGHFHGALNTGDLVIFPRELSHVMTSVMPLEGAQRHLAYREALEMDGTGLLCGSVRFRHPGSRFILDALPPVFIIRYDHSNYWLKSLLDIFVAENMHSGPATKVIFDKLSELLFTYAIRQYLMDHPSEVGMLAIFGHTRLAVAIREIHRHPDWEWTLDIMARAAAMSRTVFAETFKRVSGWTPGQYLTWWRMQLAWSLLSDGITLAETANQVGYKSESAFSRAFQRMFGTAAGVVRRSAARRNTPPLDSSFLARD